jgi:hypothetical protein
VPVGGNLGAPGGDRAEGPCPASAGLFFEAAQSGARPGRCCRGEPPVHLALFSMMHSSISEL